MGQMYRKTLNFQMKINRNLGMYFVEVEGGYSEGCNELGIKNWG